MEALLEPATLGVVVGGAVGAVRVRPLTPEFAKSGSRIVLVETAAGPRFVVKRVNMAWDWLMRATEDQRCRSVSLWLRGLLDRLPPAIEHGVLACARDGDGWAILMRDLGETLVTNRPFSPAENRVFLDAMAAMHATFLDDPALRDPELGLCELRHVYGMFSPHTARREAGGADEVPQRIAEGWAMLADYVDRDVAEITLALADDPTPLCAALARYPATLIHGDWRHANQGIRQKAKGKRQNLAGAPPASIDMIDQGLTEDEGPTAKAGAPLVVGPSSLARTLSTRVVLLDWQLAAAGPPGVELGRYLGANSALLPGAKEETLGYYRERLAARLGARFDEAWWAPQLALGLLGGFVQDGWAIVLKATHWRVGADARAHWRGDLAWWARWVRAGAALLVK